MPKCVVRKCPHQTGKKSLYPHIVLHPFPKNIMLIQDWLRLAGMQEENLELVSLEILEDKRSDKFRMCSAHFTQDSYILKGSKRVLKVDARPSKFPEKSVLDFVHPPMMHRIAQRVRIEQHLAFSADAQAVKAKCTCECHTHLKSKLVNSSTQTEGSDFLTPAAVDPYLILPSHKHVAIDQALEEEPSTAEKAMIIMVPPSIDIVPVKKWEIIDFQIEQGSSKDTTEDEEMITSEESFFGIMTVEDGETTEAQIKEENLENENSMTSEKGRFSNDTASFLTVSHQKKGGYVTKIKKKLMKNESCSSSLEKPIHTRAVPFVKDLIKKKEGDRVKVKKKVPSKQSTSLFKKSSTGDVSGATKLKRKKNSKDANITHPSKPLCGEEDTVPSTSSLPLEEKYAKEKKYVVFESCLDTLLLNMRCQQKYCSERIKQCDKHTVGTLLVVFATCCGGHSFRLWESQPRVNGVGAGNVLLATLLVLTGSNFSKIKELCNIIALQIFSESSFHKYEEKYIFPSIDQWIQEEDESEMKSKVEEEDAAFGPCERKQKC